MVAGNASVGRGCCFDILLKLARVGVVESSIRFMCGEGRFGAVLGRGVVGVVLSPWRLGGSGANVVFTVDKLTDMVAVLGGLTV